MDNNIKEIIRGVHKDIESLENKIDELERLVDCSIDNHYDGAARYSDHFIPLVDRKAQKDEWIYIIKSGDDRAVVGEIYQFIEEDSNSLYIKYPDGMRYSDGAANIAPL